MKKNYITKLILALMLGFFGLTNASAQDIVKIGTWMTDKGINEYYMSDIDGVITIVKDEGQDAVKWAQISAGEFEGMPAYYYKNVATGAYMIPGEQVEDGGDWKVHHGITTTIESDDARWVRIASRWGEGTYLASVQEFVSADYESNKPFIALGFFTMAGGNIGDAWGVQGPAASVMSPGPGASNAWCAVQIREVTKPAALPDLIITEVRWEPANPKQGDQIEFFATIKNIGEGATPSGIKHGVAFFVNNSVVSWSDGYFTSIPAGEEVEISSRMEGSSGDLWTVGSSATYNIKAHVNDQTDMQETNYDNNFFETVLTVTTGIEKVLANSGNVYFANGSLQVINYPASAILRVYSLVGVNVSGSLSVSEVKSANLSSGIYVIEVQSEGKTFTHKVIVK